LTGNTKFRGKINGGENVQIRLGDGRLPLSEMPLNFAKGGNRLTKNAQDVMVSGVLLKLLIYSKPFHFCIRKGNAQKITEGQLRKVPPFLWYTVCACM